MMEKVTQMIAMLIKAWKKESVSQIDAPSWAITHC